MIINKKPFIGRKKTSVSKANFILDEKFSLIINGIPATSQQIAFMLNNLPKLGLFNYKIQVYTNGGGIVSGLLSILKSISIGLSSLHPDLKSEIKDNPYNWYDERIVERKKFGRRGARRSPQWVKR